MRELIHHLGYVPKTCVWEITRTCNLSCHHCGSLAGCARPGELSTEECLRVVDELAELGTQLITLSGGEPTLRPDWPVIARRAIAAGITVNMVTNGQGNARALAERARAVGLANVAVSLDGLRAVHDRIRAEGSFERVCHTVRTLTAAGIWVDVMFTANRWNLAQLPEVYALARDLGARGFRVQLGKPMGRQTDREDMTLAPRDLLTLLPMLAELDRAEGPVVMIGDSIGYYSPAERALRGDRCSQGCWTGCYAGVQAIGIQSDGGVKGCLSLQPRDGEADPFLEGNVRETPLRAIWQRPGAFAYNRGFSMDQLTGACARCSHARICRGGAKCVAHAFTGETSCDPMCWLAASRASGLATRVLPASATSAAAAILLSIGIGGCGPTVGTGGTTGAGGTTGTGTGGTAGMGTGGTGAMGTGGMGAGGTTTVKDGGSDAADDAAPDAPIDCTTVCCACEYGVPPPPEVFKTCCCVNVCCECDYGVPPPAGCCP
jgi:MoaA/NifB/PqqE/SkfB family radical SAM enzyme